MRILSLTVLLVLAVSLLATVPVGATPTGGNDTLEGEVQTVIDNADPRKGTETASPQPTATAGSTPAASDTTRIDSQTTIIASEYVANASVARITIQSSATQTLTLSDAGRFVDGGKIPVTAVAVRGGETTTVEIPVTKQNGRVGVAITTEKTPLYAEMVQQSGGGLNILSAVSTLEAWAGGVVIAFVWMVIAGVSVLRRESGRPEVA